MKKPIPTVLAVLIVFAGLIWFMNQQRAPAQPQATAPAAIVKATTTAPKPTMAALAETPKAPPSYCAPNEYEPRALLQSANDAKDIPCRVTASYILPVRSSGQIATVTDDGYEVSYWLDHRAGCDDLPETRALQRFNADGTPKGNEIAWTTNIKAPENKVVAGPGVSLWFHPEHRRTPKETWSFGCIKDDGPAFEINEFAAEHVESVWHKDRFYVAAYGYNEIKLVSFNTACQPEELFKMPSDEPSVPHSDTNLWEGGNTPFSRFASTDNAVGFLFWIRGKNFQTAVKFFSVRDDPKGNIMTINNLVAKNSPRLRDLGAIHLSGAGKFFKAQWFARQTAREIEMADPDAPSADLTTEYELLSATGKKVSGFTGDADGMISWKNERYRLRYVAGSKMLLLERVNSAGKPKGSISIDFRLRPPGRTRLIENGKGLFALEENVVPMIDGKGERTQSANSYRLSLISCK